MAQHISVFQLKAQPGQRQAVIDHLMKWEREQKPAATGFEFLWAITKNDSEDELLGGVHFDTTENYFANAARPEQDAWYSELPALTDGEPVWFDGTDAAGFRA